MQRLTGTLREDVCSFMKISRPNLLRMRNMLDKFYRENENTFYVQLPYPEYRGSTVVSAVLQIRRSLVRYHLVSLDFSLT